LLVRTDGCERKVQRPPIRVPLGIHDGSKGMVGTSTVHGRGAAVDG
jgi:hypothetical protein